MMKRKKLFNPEFEFLGSTWHAIGVSIGGATLTASSKEQVEAEYASTLEQADDYAAVYGVTISITPKPAFKKGRKWHMPLAVHVAGPTLHARKQRNTELGKLTMEVSQLEQKCDSLEDAREEAEEQMRLAVSTAKNLRERIEALLDCKDCPKPETGTRIWPDKTFADKLDDLKNDLLYGF